LAFILSLHGNIDFVLLLDEPKTTYSVLTYEYPMKLHLSILELAQKIATETFRENAVDML